MLKKRSSSPFRMGRRHSAQALNLSLLSTSAPSAGGRKELSITPSPTSSSPPNPSHLFKYKRSMSLSDGLASLGLKIMKGHEEDNHFFEVDVILPNSQRTKVRILVSISRIPYNKFIHWRSQAHSTGDAGIRNSSLDMIWSP